ncbi:sulfurtransferase [Xanthomonas cassavae CFBP 4642]|uniref:tRNA uridine(34) hydroxylase n=1 Tax=Xanthomonas cassavae CFBP 4642 TaxID=1219375 RepID=A0ABS8HHF2_9XANT|nr:sulfurtransferase [Xanthomonas cassavae]MCC4621557.1 sulfurtransferase [Xanthomonas cassavae CFBP 4642]
MITNTAAYQFVPIHGPQRLADSVLAQAQQQELKGSVLIAEEGINLFLAGEADQVQAFYQWLQADPRFAQMRIKYSHSAQQPFARLKVKVKPEIISFRRDDASPLPGRAPAVTPAVLQQWLRNGQDDQGRPLVLLDTRNAQEVAYGTFRGALTLPIDKFTDLPAALESHRAALTDATVVSFCTGGIRCEKAAVWMQADGMDNVLQLEGGILGYFEEVGGEGYDGRCFVFDERVALDPDLRPLVDNARTTEPVKI